MSREFYVVELTSANTVPNLRPFSTALSIDPFISGVYSFNNSSSSWSDERSDSACASIVGNQGEGT